jgi:hypothetical protein
MILSHVGSEDGEEAMAIRRIATEELVGLDD